MGSRWDHVGITLGSRRDHGGITYHFMGSRTFCIQKTVGFAWDHVRPVTPFIILKVGKAAIRLPYAVFPALSVDVAHA